MVNVDEIKPGMAMTPLVQTTTSRQLVQWAAASGDFFQIHYDLEFAKARGLPGVILHGTYKHALFAKAVAAWGGPNCFVRKVEASYRGTDLINQPFTVNGEVTEVSREGDKVLVTLKLSGVSASGKESTPGSAVVEISVGA